MKVLLLSSVPPCKNYTAGIVLYELCHSVIPKDCVVLVSVVNPNLTDAIIDKSLDLPNIRLIRPLENGIFFSNIPTLFTDPISRIREKKRQNDCKKLLKKIVEYARLNNVERVWVHLESPWLIYMAVPVSEALGLPLYTMVFDDPGWYFDCVNVDRWTRSELWEAYKNAIMKSVCCATASIPMAEEYASTYNVRTQVLQHCFDTSLMKSPLSKLPDNDIFRIGYAGKIYAMDAWNQFIDYLDNIQWHIRGKKIIFRYMGPEIKLKSNNPCHFEYFGWNNQEDVVRLLSECDLLYCPYPFDPSLREISRLSFPSKIPSYLAAARPILFHGPEYSSPVRFFRDTNSGLVVTTLDSSFLASEINRLFIEPELYKNLCTNASIALKEFFSLDVMERNFFRFIN